MFPEYSTYAQLYARYLDVDKIKDMTQLAYPFKGKQVLDLCSGGGRLPKWILESFPGELKGVTLVDAERRMLPQHPLPPEVTVICASVSTALRQIPDNSMDIAFCQQGINYWFNPTDVKALHRVLKKDGLFVFNTFWKDPGVHPKVKEYVYGEYVYGDSYPGNHFVEISWRVGKTVHHVQIRDNMAPHFTKFMWIPPKEFKDTLKPYFKVAEHRRDSASLYRCLKK